MFFPTLYDIEKSEYMEVWTWVLSILSFVFWWLVIGLTGLLSFSAAFIAIVVMVLAYFAGCHVIDSITGSYYYHIRSFLRFERLQERIGAAIDEYIRKHIQDIMSSSVFAFIIVAFPLFVMLFLTMIILTSVLVYERMKIKNL